MHVSGRLQRRCRKYSNSPSSLATSNSVIITFLYHLSAVMKIKVGFKKFDGIRKSFSQRTKVSSAKVEVFAVFLVFQGYVF